MLHRRWCFLSGLVFIALLTACNPTGSPPSIDASASKTAELATQAPTSTGTPSPTATTTLTPTPSPPPTVTSTPTPNRKATQAARNATRQAAATAAAAQATEQTQSVGETDTQGVTEWKQIPIMPGASAGLEYKPGNKYSYEIKATVEEVQAFYEKEMAKLGWKSILSSIRQYLELKFPDSLILEKGNQFVVVTITQNVRTPGLTFVVILLGDLIRR